MNTAYNTKTKRLVAALGIAAAAVAAPAVLFVGAGTAQADCDIISATISGSSDDCFGPSLQSSLGPPIGPPWVEPVEPFTMPPIPTSLPYPPPGMQSVPGQPGVYEPATTMGPSRGFVDGPDYQTWPDYDKPPDTYEPEVEFAD